MIYLTSLKKHKVRLFEYSKVSCYELANSRHYVGTKAYCPCLILFRVYGLLLSIRINYSGQDRTVMTFTLIGSGERELY